MEEFVVPVPPMAPSPSARTPSGVYPVQVETTTVTVVECNGEYIGIKRNACPHLGALWENSGEVRSYRGEPALFCRVHAVFYSLKTGLPLHNNNPEPANLLEFINVERDGDNFRIFL